MCLTFRTYSGYNVHVYKILTVGWFETSLSPLAHMKYQERRMKTNQSTNNLYKKIGSQVKLTIGTLKNRFRCFYGKRKLMF